MDDTNEKNVSNEEIEELKISKSIRDRITDKLVSRIDNSEDVSQEDVELILKVLDSSDRNVTQRAQIKRSDKDAEANGNWQEIARELIRIPLNEVIKLTNSGNGTVPTLPDINFSLNPGEFDESARGGTENSEAFAARMANKDKK